MLKLAVSNNELLTIVDLYWSARCKIFHADTAASTTL